MSSPLELRRLGIETGLWLAWAIVAVAYLPALSSAAFLSDGAAILSSVHQWSAQHELWTRIGGLFVGRLPTGNNYYRPLPFATFALDFTLFGAHAAGWRVMSVGWHLVAVAGVYGLAGRLAVAPTGGTRSSGRADGRAPALVAALLFGLSPTGPEVAIWVAGRYDVIATAAIFVALYAQACSATGSDRPALASWVATVVALASKESAAVIGPVSALIALRSAWAAQPRADRALVSAFLRHWGPFIAIFAAYVAWREYVFGSALHVYASDRLVWNVDLLASLDSIRGWYAGLVPDAALRTSLSGLVAATLASAAWRARTNTRATELLAFAILAAIVSVGLVLPHKPLFAATGEDARLFYTATGFAALALATAALPGGARMASRLGLVLALATAGTGAIALEHNIHAWTSASHGMRALLRELDASAAQLGPGDYGFVVIPDHLGAIPFGRNAQGALITPPLQKTVLSHRLVPMIPDDLGRWFAKLGRGIVPALRNLPLAAVDSSLPAYAVAPRPRSFAPTRYFCWASASRALVSVSGVDATTENRWLASWKSGLERAGCPGLAGEVPPLSPR